MVGRISAEEGLSVHSRGGGAIAGAGTSHQKVRIGLIIM